MHMINNIHRMISDDVALDRALEEEIEPPGDHVPRLPGQVPAPLACPCHASDHQAQVTCSRSISLPVCRTRPTWAPVFEFSVTHCDEKCANLYCWVPGMNNALSLLNATNTRRRRSMFSAQVAAYFTFFCFLAGRESMAPADLPNFLFKTFWSARFVSPSGKLDKSK